MIELFSDNLLSSAVISLAVAGIITSILSLFQLRKTQYRIDLNRVELDHSRFVLEREVERLHEKMYRDNSRLEELNHLLIDSVKSQKLDIKNEIGVGPAGERFLSSMGIDVNSIKVSPNFAFVLTPLNKNQLKEYEAIKSECHKIGLTVRRGDETRISGPILPHILREIASSRFIIANINGRNPNVFYELGIAQALGKSVILIVRSYSDVPFDLRQQQLVIYNRIEDLSSELRLALSRFALSE